MAKESSNGCKKVFSKKLINTIFILLIILLIPISTLTSPSTAEAMTTTGYWTDYASTVAPDLIGTTYIIDNAAELAWVAKSGNDFNGYTIKISDSVTDIDLSAHYWKPIALFLGVFNGNNKPILNLKIDDSNGQSSGKGFFDYVSGATIENVKLQNVLMTLTNQGNTGSLAAYVSNSSIFNCSASGSITLNTLGSNTSVGDLSLGGLIAVSDNSTISNCKTNINIDRSCGIDRYGYTGGLIGWSLSSDVLKSFASGSIQSQDMSSIGGLIGETENGKVTDSYGECTVSSTRPAIVGGLIGYSSGTKIQGCNTKGYVNIGGNLAGEFFQASAGGLVGSGRNGTIINDSFSVGEVTGGNDAKIGGLIGSSESNITNCYSKSNVTGGDSYVGGLVGSTGSDSNSIINCYATGNVSGSRGVGGLVGFRYNGIITNCYASGNISGNEGRFTGGLIGYNANSAIITSGFWNVDAIHTVNSNPIDSSLKIGVGGTADTSLKMSSAEMKSDTFLLQLNTVSSTSLKTWKFVTESNNGYPVLDGVGDGISNTLTQIALSSPIVGDTFSTDKVHFVWNAVSGAHEYQLFFNNQTTPDQVVSKSTTSYDFSYPTGSYTFRIDAYNDIGQKIATGNVAFTVKLANTVKVTVKDSTTDDKLYGATITLGTQTGTSDPSGYYEFKNIANGTYNISCVRSGFKTFNGTIVVSDRDVDYPIALESDGKLYNISGKVLNDSDNTPVQGATITSGSKTATTDSNGLFTLSNLYRGSYTIDVTKDGYASKLGILQYIDSNDVTMADVRLVISTISTVELTLNKSDLTLNENGEEFILIATSSLTNQPIKNPEWHSNNTSVVYVDNNGKLRPNIHGSATVTVTDLDTNKYATCKVIVLPDYSDGNTVILDKTEYTFKGKGEELQLTAALVSTNNPPKELTWSSNNSNVVSVDNNGKLLSISHGTAVITAYNTETGYFATCTVTVDLGLDGLKEYFPDRNLREFIATQIVNPTGNILKDLKTIEKINIPFDCYVNKYDGMEYLSNLEFLDTPMLRNGGNISFVSKLTKLEAFGSYNSGISDIRPLSNLSNLRHLYLPYNEITSIDSLADLKNLTFIDLSNNKISNIDSLKELDKLEELNINNNRVKNISVLSDLYQLHSLDLLNNEITDYGYTFPFFRQLYKPNFNYSLPLMTYDSRFIDIGSIEGKEICTIKFNDKVDPKNIDRNIFVLKVNGDKLEYIDTMIEVNGNDVLVSPYISYGEGVYYIFISNNIYKEDNPDLKINSSIKMKFTVRNSGVSISDTFGLNYIKASKDQVNIIDLDETNSRKYKISGIGGSSDIGIYSVNGEINFSSNGVGVKASLNIGATTMNIIREIDPDWAIKIAQNIEQSKTISNLVDPTGNFETYMAMRLIDMVSKNNFYIGGWSEIKDILDASADYMDELTYKSLNGKQNDKSYIQSKLTQALKIAFMRSKIQQFAPNHFQTLYDFELKKRTIVSETNIQYMNRIEDKIEKYYNVVKKYEYLEKSDRNLQAFKNELEIKFPIYDNYFYYDWGTKKNIFDKNYGFLWWGQW